MPYFDFTYLLFMIPGLLITMWAQFKIKSTFAKYNQVRTASGATGAQVARVILDGNNLANVDVVAVKGELTDYYSPNDKMVALSGSTYAVPSVAAVGVAAHECGHAVQDATSYFPMRIRSAIIPICNIGSAISMPMIVIGFALSFTPLVTIGIVLFSLMVVFQLVTLPVEFNASSRALKTLETRNMLTTEELAGVKAVLSAAALTYVAAMLTSVLQLLYFVTRANRKKQ